MHARATPIDQLHTQRLVGVRASPEHLEYLVSLFQDARVVATLRGVRSLDETKAMLQQYETHWAEHGFGMWVFRDLRTRQFIGRGGLRRVEVAGKNEVEIAYAVAANQWGRGLATEMAEASVEVAFSKLKLSELVAFTLHDNFASRRVMEKVGFRYESDIVHANLPHVLYRKSSRTGMSSPSARRWHGHT